MNFDFFHLEILPIIMLAKKYSLKVLCMLVKTDIQMHISVISWLSSFANIHKNFKAKFRKNALVKIHEPEITWNRTQIVLVLTSSAVNIPIPHPEGVVGQYYWRLTIRLFLIFQICFITKTDHANFFKRQRKWLLCNILA